MSAALLILVPLLLLPVVGLLAFAGCAPFDADTPAPPEEPPIPRKDPAYPDVIQNTVGLVAYWRLDDPVGSLIARDSGPSDLDGRYVAGPPDVELAKPGGALAARDPQDRCAGFPGEKAHVNVDLTPLLNPGSMLRFSFEVWVRLRNPAARVGKSEHLASSRVFSLSGDSSGWELFVTYGPGGVPTFTARVFSGVGNASTRADAIAQSAATPPDGAWHHVVLTYDGRDGGTVGVFVRLAGESKLYPKTTSPAAYGPNTAVDFTLGAALTLTPYNELEGDLDEAAFYNSVLSAAQIETHHAAAQATR